MKRAAFFSISVASLLIIIKLFTWWFTDSLSLFSSLVDSLFDLVASALNLFAVRYSLMPADKEHRFGHGKAEDLASLGQAMFISGTAFFIMIEGIKRLFSPVPIEHGMAGIAVSVFSIALTAILIAYQRHVIRKTDSTAIRSDSLHYVTDLLTNLGVIIALLLYMQFSISWADPVMALLITAYLLHNAWQVGHDAFQKLMDRELDDDDRQKIKDVVAVHPKVIRIHDLRTRRAGIRRFIQFNIILPDDMSLLAAHQVSDELEASLAKLFIDAEILIHQAPLSGKCHDIT